VGDGSLVVDGRCPDFWDGGNRLVELFGGFWHRDDGPQERVDFFARRGYDCVVVWDSELKDVEGVIRKIKTLYPEEEQIEKVQVKQGT
jgi:very-short-patch-repair endonuclease